MLRCTFFWDILFPTAYPITFPEVILLLDEPETTSFSTRSISGWGLRIPQLLHDLIAYVAMIKYFLIGGGNRGMDTCFPIQCNHYTLFRMKCNTRNFNGIKDLGGGENLREINDLGGGMTIHTAPPLTFGL